MTGFFNHTSNVLKSFQAEGEEIGIPHLRELSCMCGSPSREIYWHIAGPVLHLWRSRLSRVGGSPVTLAGHLILLQVIYSSNVSMYRGAGGEDVRGEASPLLCITVHLNSDAFIQSLEESCLIFKPQKMQRSISKYHRNIKIINFTKLFWKISVNYFILKTEKTLWF